MSLWLSGLWRQNLQVFENFNFFSFLIFGISKWSQYKKDGKEDTNTNYIINSDGKLICLSAHLTFAEELKSLIRSSD